MLAVAWIPANSWQEKLSGAKLSWSLLIPVLFYSLVLVAGLANTENVSNGAKLLEKNSGLLVIPLLLATGPRPSAEWIRRILVVFLFGCVVVLFVDVGFAARNYMNTHNSEEFFYWQLTDWGSPDNPFHHNPIYLALHFVFGIMVCIHLVLTSQSRNEKLVFLVVAIILLAGVLLLSSKTAFGILIAYVSVIRFKELMKYSLKVRVALTAGAIIVLGIFVASFGSVLRERYREVANFDNFTILKEDIMNDFSRVNGLSLRLMFWKFGITESIATHQWFWGQGTGDVQDFLNKVYEKHNMALRVSETEVYGYYEYNAHNQYVESFLKNGIAGLIATLTLYAVGIAKAARVRDRLMIALMIAVCSISLTESFLEANKGIVFTAFFLALFYLPSATSEQSRPEN